MLALPRAPVIINLSLGARRVVDAMINYGEAFIAALKRNLQQQFEMKDPGPLSSFLGLQIA